MSAPIFAGVIVFLTTLGVAALSFGCFNALECLWEWIKEKRRAAIYNAQPSREAIEAAQVIGDNFRQLVDEVKTLHVHQERMEKELRSLNLRLSILLPGVES